MMARVRDILGGAGLAEVVHDDDGEAHVSRGDLSGSVVFKRVAEGHSDLPRIYVRALLESAGFASIAPR
jgi:hypothetical protein